MIEDTNNQPEPIDEVEQAVDEPTPVVADDEQADINQPADEQAEDSDDDHSELPKKTFDNSVVESSPILTDDTAEKDTPRLSVLYTSLSELLELTKQWESVKLKTTEDLIRWRDSINIASGVVQVLDDALSSAAARAGAQWRQHGEFEGAPIRAFRPAIAKAESGSTISGERAIQKVTSLLSLGQTLQIPLWHSGFWVTIKAPALAARLELEQRIANMRVSTGRQTRGVIFGNEVVYVVNTLMDFILEHVFDCNITGWNIEMLRQKIKVPDIQLLAWGMACTIYSKGFPFSQPCTADIKQCTYVARSTINISKLLWVDNSQLSQKQLKQMSKRNAKITDVQVDGYQEEWTVPSSKVFKLNDAISIVFEMPSIESHVQSGMDWIDSIERMTEEAFGKNLTGSDRDDYIEQQAAVTRVRKYSHWVKHIVLSESDDNVVTVDDRETIESICEQLSSDDDLVDAFVKATLGFINDSVVAFTAIPNYACPSCGKWHLTEGSAGKHLLPIDAVGVFFLMQQFKLQTTFRKADMS